MADVIALPTPAAWSDEQWEAHDARVAAERERDAAAGPARAKSPLLERGWPARAVEFAVTADHSRPGIEAIERWPSGERNVLVLGGVAGCGKTVAAAWWARQQRVAPQFVRASTFASSSRYDRETRDGWLKASALVLDDLGAEYLDTKGSLVTDLDELVDVFYGDRRPLVITTNLAKAAFKARYGERIVDRIRECGHWEAIGGQSLRSVS